MEGDIIAKLLKSNDRAYADMDLLVIGANGEQLGVKRLAAACNAARDAGLDLVLVAENATPPVCRIQDFGKLVYEQKKKLKDQKKNSAVQKTKEIKFRLHIDTHDYEFKLNHAREFLAEGDKLRVTLMLKGREMARPEMGFELMNRIVADLDADGSVESPAKLLGRNIQMSFNPKGSH